MVFIVDDFGHEKSILFGYQKGEYIDENRITLFTTDPRKILERN